MRGHFGPPISPDWSNARPPASRRSVLSGVQQNPSAGMPEDAPVAETPDENTAGDSAPSQSEMPFAIVYGKAFTEIPKDLYIPPDALEVILEAFEGPLDLLLYLIRRQNIDILE